MTEADAGIIEKPVSKLKRVLFDKNWSSAGDTKTPKLGSATVTFVFDDKNETKETDVVPSGGSVTLAGGVYRIVKA